MADFRIAFDETMIKEGGYANDPDDAGGETYRGIARRFHPDWAGWETVDQAKRSHPDEFKKRLRDNSSLDHLVETFYRAKFWDAVKGDEIPNQHVANELFDTGVNQGVVTATRFFQESLNLLNRNQSDYKDIDVDGKVGSNTLRALQQLLKIEDNHADVLLKMMNIMQGARYIQIMRDRPSQQKFARGWLSRVKLA